MKLNNNKINLAKDILINSSDIKTLIAIKDIKKLNKYKKEIINNKLKIKELDIFIKDCIRKYKEIIDLIEDTIDNNIYLYKKDYYLKRLDLVELGIYTHILLIKGKIDEVYEIMYSIE